MFGAVLGVLILGEVLMMPGWSGVIVLVAGVVFVALDHGEMAEEGGQSEAVISKGAPPNYWVIVALTCANAYACYNSECTARVNLAKLLLTVRLWWCRLLGKSS